MRKIRDVSLRILTANDVTEKRMREKLAQRGFSEDEIDGEIAFLKEYKYIDDERWAKRYVESASKKYGGARIRRELYLRGIENETAEAAAQDAPDPRETVETLLARRFAGADLSERKERARAFAYLMRRGFSSQDIMAALRRKSVDGEEDWFEN